MAGGTGGGGNRKAQARGHTRLVEPGACLGQAGREQNGKQQGRGLLRFGPLTRLCWEQPGGLEREVHCDHKCKHFLGDKYTGQTSSGQSLLDMTLTSAVSSQYQGPSQGDPHWLPPIEPAEVCVVLVTPPAACGRPAPFPALEAQTPGLEALAPAGWKSRTGTSDSITFFPFPHNCSSPPNSHL